MLTFLFDHQAKAPMYEQLYKFIRREIENGNLEAEEKLPSKRALASHLKISTVTVEAAYAQLVAEGYLKSVPRSGFFAQPLNAFPPETSADPTAFPAEKTRAHYDYDFKTSAVDTKLFPFSTWAKLGREILSQGSDALLNITHPQGAYELRNEIATYLHDFRGIKARPEQIVVGAGSEYMMGLLIQLLGREHLYAVENPGYGKIFHTMQRNGATTIPIALDAEGLSVAKLKMTKANIAHVTPSHQFPLGIIMPVSRRLSLLNWANEKEGRYIVEDDYDSEFRFSGQPIPALQGLDASEKVIYLNAFTKSLAPSLRISYMVLPWHLLEKYRESFLFYSCTVPNFEQYILSNFMAKGHFEHHLRRMRNAYKEKRDYFMNAVTKSLLGETVRFIGYDAGLHLLMELDNGLDEKTLVEKAKNIGIRVYGLSEYYHFPAENLPRSTIVIGYSGLCPSEIEAAVKKLEIAWQNELK